MRNVMKKVVVAFSLILSSVSCFHYRYIPQTPPMVLSRTYPASDRLKLVLSPHAAKQIDSVAFLSRTEKREWVVCSRTRIDTTVAPILAFVDSIEPTRGKWKSDPDSVWATERYTTTDSVGQLEGRKIFYQTVRHRWLCPDSMTVLHTHMKLLPGEVIPNPNPSGTDCRTQRSRKTLFDVVIIVTNIDYKLTLFRKCELVDYLR